MFPDPRLRQAAAPVVDFDDDLRQLAQDLLDTLEAHSAIGITAPHVGIARRVVALRLPGTVLPRIYVNPRVIWASDELARHGEGSVSMPGVSEQVERPQRVRIAYEDVAGETAFEEADGFAAACHQHEIDQLDGIFWTQRLSPLRRERLVKRWQKQRK